MKKVSVVMSIYNESISDLEMSIESILNQTLHDLELIIVLDNPQNSNLKSFIKDYQKKDKRIILIINNKNLGLAMSLNKAIKASSADLIARMDADDISLQNRLELQYNFFKENNEIDILGTNKVNIDESGNIISSKVDIPVCDAEIKKWLLYCNPIIHPSVMFKKNQIEKIGMYRNFPSSQDYDLWLRAYSSGLKFANLNDVLLKYRVRQSSISNSNTLKQYILKKYALLLYNQRNKSKTDNFSIANMEKYLNKKGAFQTLKINKFKRGLEKINVSKRKFHNHKYISGCFVLCCVLFSDINIFFYLCNSFRRKLIVRK